MFASTGPVKSHDAKFSTLDLISIFKHEGIVLWETACLLNNKIVFINSSLQPPRNTSMKLEIINQTSNMSSFQFFSDSNSVCVFFYFTDFLKCVIKTKYARVLLYWERTLAYLIKTRWELPAFVSIFVAFYCCILLQAGWIFSFIASKLQLG